MSDESQQPIQELAHKVDILMDEHLKRLPAGGVIKIDLNGTRFDSLEADLKTALELTEISLTNIRKRLDQIETWISKQSAAESDMKTARELIGMLTEASTNVQNNLDRIERRLSYVEQRSVDLIQERDSADVKATGIEARLFRVEQKLTEPKVKE